MSTFFLDPLPDSRADLELPRDDLRVFGLYSGTLVASDETATAIQLGVPAGIDRIRLCAPTATVHDEGGAPA
jgi:hypothetical protein